MADPAVDTVLDGKYRIVRLLGEGGMGAVYVAEHLFLRKHVALKVLRAELATNLEVGARFLREARDASVIEHENVVRGASHGTSTRQGAEGDLAGPRRVVNEWGDLI